MSPLKIHGTYLIRELLYHWGRSIFVVGVVGLAVSMGILLQVLCQGFQSSTQLPFENLDADTKAGKARLKASGMKGHIPVVIFVDGEFKHSLEGQEVIFENFPVASDSPMRLDGKWSAGDVKAVIEEILGAN